MSLNKFSSKLDSITSLSYEEIEAIAKHGATSFYLLDLDKLRDNVEQLRSAFVGEYANTQLAYSFKTNYLPAICHTLKDLGCWAEVVSEMEYDIATKRIGYEPGKIIINGPLHERGFIRRALLDGALLNLDAWYLLDQVAQVCLANPQRQFHIGVRLTYPIIEGGFSRFGIEASEENIQRLAKWQASVANCDVVGFHSHFSDSSRSLASFHSRIQGLLSVIERFFTDAKPQFINIGGGFFGDMPTSLAHQFGGDIPNFVDYAKQTAGAVRNKYPRESGPVLLMEPGTALVANTMVFICKVYEVKQIAEKTYALVNGSNHNVNHKWQGIALPIEIIRQTPLSNQDGKELCFDLVGNTCIEKDILCTDLNGSIKQGDYVVFQYMGGYSNVLKQPFIHPCQPIYALQNHQLALVKRQETVEDILATYL